MVHSVDEVSPSRVVGGSFGCDVLTWVLGGGGADF